LTIDFDNRKQAFGTRATIRDQMSSPEGYPLQSSISKTTSAEGYNTSIRDQSHIPPAILWRPKLMLTNHTGKYTQEHEYARHEGV